jgi:hypothetical protein
MVPRADADALQGREISPPVEKRTKISRHCTEYVIPVDDSMWSSRCLYQDETGGTQTRTVDTVGVQVHKTLSGKSEGTNVSVDGRTQQKMTLKWNCVWGCGMDFSCGHITGIVSITGELSPTTKILQTYTMKVSLLGTACSDRQTGILYKTNGSAFADP